MNMSDLSLKAAREAAAKVNAMLVATGQLRPSDLNKGKSKNGKSSDLFVEEVIINDAPMSARNFLTRSYTQEEISKMSGASVSTRGRYMTQEEIDKNTSNDRPLYLHIQGVNQQDVKVAVGRIMHLIMEHTHRKISLSKNKNSKSESNSRTNRHSETISPFSEPSESEPLQFQPNMIREKVFLPSIAGLNPVEVRCRLLGDNNSNLKYIQDDTGASVLIRGIGSGFIEPTTGMEFHEALHFYIEHTNQEKFNEAKDLVVNLAQTILAQMHQEQQDPMQHPPPPTHFHQTLRPQLHLNGNGMTTQLALPNAIGASNQAMVVHAGQQMPPPGIIPQQPPTNHFPQVMTQQGVTTGPMVTLPGQPIQELAAGTQLIQIAVTSAGPTLVSQQLVQTSAGPQLVQLPHGTHIVSTPDGPRLVPLTPSSVSTAFVTPTSTAEQTMHVGVAIPPQPVPPVSRSDLGENYSFEGDKSLLQAAPPPTSSAFAYVQQHEVLAPPCSSVSISHPQWTPPVNTIVLSQSQVEVVQAPHHQPPPTTQPSVDWNLRAQPPVMSYSAVQDPNGHLLNKENVMKSAQEGGSFMWAQYPPQVRENVPSRAPSGLHREPPPSITTSDGGRKSADDGVRSEMYHPDACSRQPPRKASAQPGFESKRPRRSFKPKGEFRAGHRPMNAHLDDGRSGSMHDQLAQPSTSVGVNQIPPQEAPFNPEMMGGPPPPWNHPQWDSNGALNNSVFGLPRPQKSFESPWESGIPGIPADIAMNRDVRSNMTRRF